ncbi:hypothetical protein [Paenibacillus methanolicus]|nr:hypothetical protein [Paenibacillus methanolicus]
MSDPPTGDWVDEAAAERGSHNPTAIAGKLPKRRPDRKREGAEVARRT